MADVDNKWSLFGLDLSRSGGWVALGVHQLMCDPGAWLLKRFDPSIRVIQGGEALLYRADTPLCKAFAADEQTPFSAVALSVDAVLFKTLHLPSSTEEDLEQAARWYRAAADQGHADAQYNLGLMTLRGQGGLKMDRSEAFVWWGRAVMQNHLQAVRQINRLAGLLSAEEIRFARQTIHAWGEGQRVPQLYVVREGD